jgi:hypothetical protein
VSRNPKSIIYITYLVDLVATILLQISANVAEEGYVEDCRSNKQKQGADKNEDGEHDGDQEHVRDHIRLVKIFTNLPPVTSTRTLCQIKGIKSQSVNRLAWSVC